MKKIFAKDNFHRSLVKKEELNNFILKQISANLNVTKVTNWNAMIQLLKISKQSSKTHLSNRCVKTINRKVFHKFFNFSRIIFIRLAKSGQISGLRKSSW